MKRYSSNHRQSVVKNQFKKNTIRPLSGLVLMGLLASTAQAGKITSVPSASEAEGFGGWNEGNIEVIVDGTQGAINSELSWYDELTGAYNFAADSDNSYIANVDDGAGTITGIALAKTWPVGEPPGIKVINDDLLVKAPKPPNCIMATSYLADHFLDSDDPLQVLCSGPFQSHKRYKLAMLPASVDGIGSDAIDLVFNVVDEPGAPPRDYQIFQKINNWTDGRLVGFKVQVGVGVGANFETASEAGISLNDLNISVPSAIWSAEQLAVFSVGLFGPLDKHTGSIGFFDPVQRAGFLIDEYVETGTPPPPPPTDTLTATETLGSDYKEVPAGATNQFGPWIANNMLPYGVFFDDDGNPETDAQLLAWYGWNPNLKTPALGWMGGSQDNFAAISDEDIGIMSENLAYTMGEIDDLVNVGLSYIVTIGDVTTFPGTTFTIRVTPTAETVITPPPPYVGHHPVPELVFTSSDAAVLLDPNPEFVVNSLLTARVGDADLNIDSGAVETVDVAIATDTGLRGTLTLIEQGENRGVFVASLPEKFSNVAIGTIVSMTYVDADNGSGVAETKTSSSTAVEDLPPITSDVSINDFTVPATVTDKTRSEISLEILNGVLKGSGSGKGNKDIDPATGSVLITGTDGSVFTGEFTDLKAGKTALFTFKWKAELVDRTVPEVVTWSATVTVNGQIVDQEIDTTDVEVRAKGKQ